MVGWLVVDEMGGDEGDGERKGVLLLLLLRLI